VELFGEASFVVPALDVAYDASYTPSTVRGIAGHDVDLTYDTIAFPTSELRARPVRSQAEALTTRTFGTALPSK